ncbi:MAG: M1 family metallopeptidase [Candidatus Thorarchaeota archaeon]
MKKISLMVFICLFVFNFFSFSALSKHIVDYRIKAKLIPAEKAVSGEEILTWLNDSEVPVSELQFHLYLNAFKNNRSTFRKDRGGSGQGSKPKRDDWGYIDVKKIRIKDGIDLTLMMEFIQPDDDNKDDQTVMRVLLPEPVPPKETITLEIAFYSKLPGAIRRAGFYDNFFMVTQWFPKIGVLEDGKWNCHQYHANSEFFADFGVFEVEITVPNEYVVGATGVRTDEITNADGTRTYTHYQEDVHDFAWTACPDFVEYHEQYTLNDPFVDTEMIFLIHRTHINLQERYVHSLKNGIEFYSQSYGPYPYRTITLVDPPIKALGAGGMEYPTLFTSAGVSFLPEGFRMPEMVTIHEFGHGYWYGMVANNEFEEAWLDEGINSYSEIKAMDKFYGRDRSMIDLGCLKISDSLMARTQVIASGRMDPVVKKSWKFYSGGSYGVNVYQKAALTLLTLENYLGEDVMARVMKAYYELWKFRHPKTDDFVAVAEEVSGQDLGWFFDQFLHSPDKLDYAIGRLRSREIKEPEGIFQGELRSESNDKSKDREKSYLNEVVVVRKGELVFPQEILIVFEDGKEVREMWDGRDRWTRFTYTRPVKLKSAQLDPENKILLDINHMNNSMTRKPDKIIPLKYALNLMLKFQKVLTVISME